MVFIILTFLFIEIKMHTTFFPWLCRLCEANNSDNAMVCLSLPTLRLAPVVIGFIQCPQLFFFCLRSSASFRTWWSSCHLWQYNLIVIKLLKEILQRPTVSNHLTQLTNKRIRLLNISLSVATLLWRKTPEFTLKKTQIYKMFKKVKTKFEKHATGTCT